MTWQGTSMGGVGVSRARWLAGWTVLAVAAYAYYAYLALPLIESLLAPVLRASGGRLFTADGLPASYALAWMYFLAEMSIAMLPFLALALTALATRRAEVAEYWSACVFALLIVPSLQLVAGLVLLGQAEWGFGFTAIDSKVSFVGWVLVSLAGAVICVGTATRLRRSAQRAS